VNAATESAESAQAVGEAADASPCLEIGESKVYAGLSPDGVLVIRAYPAGDTLVAVLVDETLVAGSEVDWKPRGRHRRQLDSSQDNGEG
jgi:hypothetical protein